MKHIGKALTAFGVMFFLPFCLSKERKVLTAQSSAAVANVKRANIAGEQFSSYSFFLSLEFITSPWIVCI